MRPSFAAAAITSCLTVAAALPAQAGYVLQDISGGGLFQTASDINNLGQVVGGSQSADFRSWDGYFYSAATGVVSLETRPPAGVTGPIQSWGASINDAGQIAGTWRVGEQPARGFALDPGRAMLDLNHDYLGISRIDERGRVIGVLDHGGGPDGSEVFVYTPRVGETVTAPVGGVMGVTGLRADDSVVGYRYAYDVSPYAGARAGVLNGNVWTDLAMPERATGSYTRGFNEHGVIVGQVETPYVELKTWLTSAGAWVDGEYIDIGAGVPLTEWSSQALAVNGAGVVLVSGILSPDNGGVYNFLYDLATGTFTNLATVLDPSSTVGWTDLQVTDINDRGQIVGHGRFDGQVRAFLLSPTPPVPEPGLALLMAIGCAGVAVAQRRAGAKLGMAPPGRLA